ncbi:GFA family protein [Rhizobium oryzicola]|uniref:GFA family protein n=1 Tax=Rhizobium oryzicola TaxID=1232668 RepID=A0ABT8STR6_9HYPH|nr:GFA family protein [Rhizobium oryzicola]MDO1581660.1 GFA family protein [Rhizobium oryzicola]
MTTIHTGGCQCGAIRFRAEGELSASVCHCRMCQKAFGAYYAPLVSVRRAAFSWTRGERKIFQSSNAVARGFCADCGTPLTYEAPDGIAIAHGAFDDPSAVAPNLQYGLEAKLPFADNIPSLPGHPTEEDLEEAPFLKDLVSFQHPDHDTTDWPKKDP